MKIIVILAMVQAAAYATTIHVPGDYHSIQTAINAASSRDTVLVAPGSYQENIDFHGKAITVKSSGGSSVTEIVGTGTVRTVIFQNDEGWDSVLDGFTVRNGYPDGIGCWYSTPTIMHNHVRENTRSGIDCVETSSLDGPLIMYNTVSENGEDGISEMSDAVIMYNIITENQENGIRSHEWSSAVIMHNSISENGLRGIFIDRFNRSIIAKNLIFNHSNSYQGGAGIRVYRGSPEIYYNFIFNNSTTETGGGICCTQYSLSRIANNLIWNNEAAEGGGIYLSDESCCTLINNTIVENIATIMGGGVGIGTSVAPYVPYSLISDCILWGNQAPLGPALSIDLNSQVQMNHCDVEGGQAAVHIVSGSLDWGDGMIDVDPLFTDPVAGDFRLQQDPCQPGVTNPCVDTGSSFSMNLNLHQASTRTDGVPDSGMADMGMHLGDYHLPVWSADANKLSAGTGGTVTFSLHPGFEYSGRNYLILGSVSGTQPGTPLPGGMAVLPLNWDVFTDIALSLINTPAFQEFMGQSPQFKTPVLQTGSLPGAAGISLYFAYTMNNPFDFASHPMRIDIVP